MKHEQNNAAILKRMVLENYASAPLWKINTTMILILIVFARDYVFYDGTNS